MNNKIIKSYTMTEVKPSRMGNKWEDNEVQQLLQSIRKNKSIHEIAKEHERSVGAIYAQRKKLAADYWFIDKRPMEEIIQFTGLTKEEIEKVIEMREYKDEILQQRKLRLKKQSEHPSDIKEVLLLLKEISQKLSILIEKSII